MSAEPLLWARDLTLFAPGGRALVRALGLSMGRERVAVVGRNGVGKSSLLAVLAGSVPATSGTLRHRGVRHLVSQQLERGGPACDPGASPGEQRRRALERGFASGADLLFLDEPTQDLDRDGIAWLRGRLRAWRQGLMVVSHHRELLRDFDQFCIVEEAGCAFFRGAFAGLVEWLEERDASRQIEYARGLSQLVEKERHTRRVAMRSRQKKNVGRIRELGRCPARIRLNRKRSYAQESQGKRAILQEARLSAVRVWARESRRALRVSLPLELALPVPTALASRPVVELQSVSARVAGRLLFEGIDLELRRERVAIRGPNGAGKTTLIEIAVGTRAPARGRARQDVERIGYVAQHAANFCSDESLLERLATTSGVQSLAELAQRLRAHRFPLALAERPLRSLSPGERVRAALIELCGRERAPELLVLDEPSDQLDFVGLAALERALRAWKGGLLLVSHDDELLRSVGIESTLELSA